MPLQLIALAGLAVRRKARRAWLFPLFLVAATCVRLLQLLGADRFRGWQAWIWMELLLKSLLVGVVVEITARVFRELPGAAPWAWRGLLLVVLVTGIAVWSAPGVHVPGSDPWVYGMVTQIMPRLAFGFAGMCVTTLLVMAAYGIPLDSLHGSVLFGVALYLALYAGPLGSAAAHPLSRFAIYHVIPFVYLAILVLWAYAAWRREPDCIDPTLQRLQPWR